MLHSGTLSQIKHVDNYEKLSFSGQFLFCENRLIGCYKSFPIFSKNVLFEVKLFNKPVVFNTHKKEYTVSKHEIAFGFLSQKIKRNQSIK